MAEQEKKFYTLPDLRYGYADLEPFVSEKLLRIHHDGHHKKYVDQANALLEKVDKARKEGVTLNMKCDLQSLAFNIGGHKLHSSFWKNMAPPSNGGGNPPSGSIKELIDQEFGGYERFQKEFTEAANSVESSGWVALVRCPTTGRLLLQQIKDHDLYVLPGFRILMVLDVWEHAYYLDYTNKKADYTAKFWSVVNWEEVDHRLEHILGGSKEGPSRKSVAEPVKGPVSAR